MPELLAPPRPMKLIEPSWRLAPKGLEGFAREKWVADERARLNPQAAQAQPKAPESIARTLDPMRPATGKTAEAALDLRKMMPAPRQSTSQPVRPGTPISATPRNLSPAASRVPIPSPVVRPGAIAPKIPTSPIQAGARPMLSRATGAAAAVLRSPGVMAAAKAAPVVGGAMVTADRVSRGSGPFEAMGAGLGTIGGGLAGGAGGAALGVPAGPVGVAGAGFAGGVAGGSLGGELLGRAGRAIDKFFWPDPPEAPPDADHPPYSGIPYNAAPPFSGGQTPGVVYQISIEILTASHPNSAGQALPEREAFTYQTVGPVSMPSYSVSANNPPSQFSVVTFRGAYIFNGAQQPSSAILYSRTALSGSITKFDVTRVDGQPDNSGPAPLTPQPIAPPPRNPPAYFLPAYPPRPQPTPEPVNPPAAPAPTRPMGAPAPAPSPNLPGNPFRLGSPAPAPGLPQPPSISPEGIPTPGTTPSATPQGTPAPTTTPSPTPSPPQSPFKFPSINPDGTVGPAPEWSTEPTILYPPGAVIPSPQLSPPPKTDPWQITKIPPLSEFAPSGPFGSPSPSPFGGKTTSTITTTAPAPTKEEEGLPTPPFFPPLPGRIPGPAATPTVAPNITPAGQPSAPPVPPRLPPPGATDSPCANNRCGQATLDKIDSRMQANEDRLLQKLGLGAQAADLGMIAVINSKLGPQIPNGGIAGFLGKMQTFAETAWRATKMDKVLNALTFLAAIHNAAMLSKNLGQTLGELTGLALQTIGIKDENDQAIDINSILGKTIENFAKSVVGEEVYNGTKATFNKLNRIVQTASQIIWTVRSIGDSSREIMEWSAENTGKIGNALKRWGVVGENAYKWLPERVTQQGKWFAKVDRIRNNVDSLDDAASSLTGALSEVRSIQEEMGELKEQKENFDKALKEETPKDRPDNDTVKAKTDAEKAASPSPNLEGVNRARGETP